MLWERIKLGLVLLFFVGIFIVTGSAQKDVLEQGDPRVLNFLAAGYCPDQVVAGMDKPLTISRLLIKPVPEDSRGRAKWEEEVRTAGVLSPDGPYRTFDDIIAWETRVAERNAQGVPGYPEAFKVRFLEMPSLAGGGGPRDSWALTRLMGGEAPEFMWSMATPEYHDTCHRWYVDLSPYLNKPNPYALDEDGKPIRWLDLFYTDSVPRWRATEDKHVYCIPIDQVEIAIYYNEDLLRECGIDIEKELPPQTWADFIDIQRRVKEAGKVPFLMTANHNMRAGWMMDIINDMLYASVYDQLNLVDDPDMPDTTSIDVQEKVAAFKTGAVALDDPRYWEAWRIIKEWSQYWQDGALSTGDLNRFKLGEAAMVVDGSWFVDDLEEDTKRDFKYGKFFIPPITRETSEFAMDPASPPRGVGGSTAHQYSITKTTAMRKESVEACVDLLMYLTAPQNIGPMVAETQSFLPAVRGAVLADNLKFMLPVLEAGGVRCNGFDNLDQRCVDARWSAMQSFLSDNFSKEDVLKAMKPAVERAIADQLEEYKDTWKWLPDENGQPSWKIEPPKSKLTEADRPTMIPSTQSSDGAEVNP